MVRCEKGLLDNLEPTVRKRVELYGKFDSFLEDKKLSPVEVRSIKRFFSFKIIEEEYDCAYIRLVKDTDYHTNYDIFYYFNGELVKRKHFQHYATLNPMKGYHDNLEDYCYKRYPKTELELAPELEEKRKSKEKRKRKADKLKKAIEDIKEEEYVIDFGMYKGTKITELTSNRDIEYCEWLVEQMGKEKSVKAHVFRWWVNLNK